MSPAGAPNVRRCATPKQTTTVPLVGPGATEALAGLVLGERDDRLPDRVLVLGVVGPRPDTGRPRPLEFVRAELPATGVAVGREELLSFPDGGQLARADSRIHCGSEAGQDSFAAGGHAVPVVNHQQVVAAPAQVAGEPVAVADHGFGRAGLQPVAGTAPGAVDPPRTRYLVEVDVRILGTRPQPGLGVIPGRPRRCRVQSGYLGRPRGE